ncbi:MAG: Nif3-like dinuclear metal center hexameric protein [Firmicutes bacterium]|nr:Nif3-like dinuclear metal center hexameric protein [Bacillota bacterium]
MSESVKLADLVETLQRLAPGRVPGVGETPDPEKHPWVVWKSSGIPGKAVMEIPGLVYGDPKKPIRRLGIGLTLTEGILELAGHQGLDAVLVHHPVADAASSGGVLLKDYCELYNLAILELHEAFHGIHAGRAILYGLKMLAWKDNYGGLTTPGFSVRICEPSEPGMTLGDLVRRTSEFFEQEHEIGMLEHEKERFGYRKIDGAAMFSGRILHGTPDRKITKLLHCSPYSGLAPDHLELAVKEYPDLDTVFLTFSLLSPEHYLVEAARRLDLAVVIGSCHEWEIYENCLPLAQAIKDLLPSLEITLFRSRLSAIPLEEVGNSFAREYARRIASDLKAKSG